jgi:hypothetical protein
MNGMHCDDSWLGNTGSDTYTVSKHWEMPPTSAIVQLSLSCYYEYDDQANVQLGITRVEYKDSDGVTRHKDYDPIPELPTMVSFNRMTRVDWEFGVAECRAHYILNVFFWNHVS